MSSGDELLKQALAEQAKFAWDKEETESKRALKEQDRAARQHAAFLLWDALLPEIRHAAERLREALGSGVYGLDESTANPVRGLLQRKSFLYDRNTGKAEDRILISVDLDEECYLKIGGNGTPIPIAAVPTPAADFLYEHMAAFAALQIRTRTQRQRQHLSR